MKVKHLLEYIVVFAFYGIVRILPIKISFFIIDRIADFVFFVLRIRVKVVLKNLDIAFLSTKSYLEKYKIAHSVYRNFGRTVVETLLLPCYSPNKVKKIVNMNNKECIEKILSEGKGGIIVSGHIGNWELMGVALKYFGYPINFVIGEQKNKLVDRFLNGLRKRTGVGMIPRQFSLKGVLKALKKNELVAILSDQDAGLGGVFVNFFGQLASTPGGAALFSLKSFAPIIFAFGIPSIDRKIHNLYFEEVKAELTEDKDYNMKILTQEFTTKMEEVIRKYPEHYFWLHRRWKTKPL